MELWIIKKLARPEYGYTRGYWGKRHIKERDLPKGQLKRYKQTIMKSVNDLVKDNILIKIPHGSENHYFLNPRKREEIIEED